MIIKAAMRSSDRRHRWRSGAALLVLLSVAPLGCGGGSGGTPPAAVVPPAVGNQAVTNRAPVFTGGVTVQPTALGSGGGRVNFSVIVTDPDNDPLRVAAVLKNAATGQNANSTFLSLNNGLWTGQLTVPPNGGANDIVFNVTVQATDDKVTTPSTQNGPNLTVQGLVAPPPSPGFLGVTSIGPNAAPRGTAVSVSIAGSNFASGASVRLTKSGQPDIIGTSVTVVGSTQITATFNLTSVTGSWNVVVTNSDGSSDTLVNGFTVT